MIDKPSLNGLISASTTKGWTLVQETKWYPSTSDSWNLPVQINLGTNCLHYALFSNKLKFGHISLNRSGKIIPRYSYWTRNMCHWHFSAARKIDLNLHSSNDTCRIKGNREEADTENRDKPKIICICRIKGLDYCRQIGFSIYLQLPRAQVPTIAGNDT